MDSEKPELHSTLTKQEDQKQRRQLRQYLFIVLTIWTFAAIVIIMVLFCLIKSPWIFSFFTTLAPPIYLWHRIVKDLFPMDEKTYTLKKMRIQMKGKNNKASPKLDQDSLKTRKKPIVK